MSSSKILHDEDGLDRADSRALGRYYVGMADNINRSGSDLVRVAMCAFRFDGENFIGVPVDSGSICLSGCIVSHSGSFVSYLWHLFLLPDSVRFDIQSSAVSICLPLSSIYHIATSLEFYLIGCEI